MSDGRYLVRGGEVVTPSGVARSSVLIEGGRFARIAEVLDADAEVIDASGRFVLPGLIDLHVQGAGGSDVLTDSPDAVRNVCRALARFGTTAFLATTCVLTTREEQSHIRRIVEAATRPQDGAALLGIHLEGPFISLEKRGMIQPAHICEPDWSRYQRIKEICGGWLKMMTIAPERPGALEIIRDLAASGIVPALGHTNATYEETLRGSRAGLCHVTHVANAMRSFHHRQPGALGAVLMQDCFTMQIITDGVHLHPAVVGWMICMKGPSRFAIITDGMAATGMPDGQYVYGGVEYEVQNGAARYEDGTLIGTACTQIELVRRAREFTRLGLPEVVHMASLYPARILGLEARKGSIEEGKDADLVICDRELNVETVFAAGKIVRSD